MKDELKWVVLLLLVSAIWGSTFVAIKDTLASFGAFALMAIRFSIAALALFIYIKFTGIKITNDEVKFGSMLGVFLLAANGFQTIGLNYTSANASAFITNLYVLLVPILSAMLLHKMPKRKIWLSVVIAIVGMFFMLDAGDGFNVGDLFTLACAFACALQIIYLAKYSPKCNPLSLAFVQITFVSIASAVLMVPLNEVPSSFPLSAMITLVYLAIMATVVAQVLQAEGQKRLEPSKVALIFITEPLFAAAFGLFFLGEILTTQNLFGAGLILCALLISEWGAIDF